MPPERLGSQPSPIPPRDLVDSRTTRKMEATVPVPRPHRCSLRLNDEAGSQKRRAAGGGVGSYSAYTAGKVSVEESAILTVAEACDGTTAGLAARRR
jgi:hypothetical protein